MGTTNDHRCSIVRHRARSANKRYLFHDNRISENIYVTLRVQTLSADDPSGVQTGHRLQICPDLPRVMRPNEQASDVFAPLEDLCTVASAWPPRNDAAHW